MTEEHVTTAMHAQYVESVNRVAARLRQTADEIERRGTNVRPNLRDMQPDYASAVGDVMHALTTGLGNLHPDSLIRIAAEADRYARLVTDAHTPAAT